MLKKISFNNLRCMIGQKKYGVQFGGDYILKHMNICNNIYNNITLPNLRKDCENKVLHKIPPHSITIDNYKRRLYLYEINNININNHNDYIKGYNIVNQNLKKGIMNINLGGDHSIGVCTVKPLIDMYNRDLLVIWIDAHADINTITSSNTGNTHGMPVGNLMGLKDCWNPIYIKSINKLHTSNIIYVGIRDLDDFEKTIIHKRKIKFFRHFNTNLLDLIKKHPAKYIHISCDIDSMNPNIIPSTGTPVAKGLLLEQVETIINTCKDRLIGFDLVEFNPMIGSGKEVRKTVTNIEKIINNVIKF